jgi:hypothetical protein
MTALYLKVKLMIFQLAGCRRDQAGSRFAHIQVLIWRLADRISNDEPFSGHFHPDLG